MRAIEPGRIERVLIRGTNWVGDAVMSIPAMREVRRLFSGAHITLLVRPWVKDVYSAANFVDEILEYDKPAALAGLPGLRRTAAELRARRFDLAILLQNAFEAAALAWIGRIPLRLGYARDARSFLLTHAPEIEPEVRVVHQCYYYLGILSGAGLLPPQRWRDRSYHPSIAIGVREEDRAAARALLRGNGHGPWVGINPGASYGGAKRWLADRYAQVADGLVREYGAQIVIFGAASDLRVAEKVAGLMRSKPLILAGRTTLGMLMGLLAECRLLITNDSGPMHLAAALDTPQLAIFGSTSEIATGPLSPAAEVIKEPVPCNPCFLRECPIQLQCMTGITAERVLAAAARKLEQTAARR